MTPFSVYGTLFPPNVAVVLQASQKGFQVKSYQSFGKVNAVNYACITTDVGQSVCFTLTDAIEATAFGTNYYILDENLLIFRENL